MTRGDDAVSTVIGAIVVLGLLGTALVYVNAVYVPRQGASMEVATTDRVESALIHLASTLASRDAAPSVVDVPLRIDRATPPLLSGVILTPARAEGTLALDTSAPLVTLSALMDAPSGGVPANDPTRIDAGNGKMRLYLLGNATRGTVVGSLVTTVGGAYTTQATYVVEAGAVVAKRTGTSSLVAPPFLTVSRGGTASVPTTLFAWTVPLLGGTTGQVGGTSTAEIAFTPGPTATLGGGTRVYNLTIQVNTTSLGAWRNAFLDVVGTNGYVNWTATGAADNGTVFADIAPPPGTSSATRAVELRVWATRLEVSLTDRVGG